MRAVRRVRVTAGEIAWGPAVTLVLALGCASSDPHRRGRELASRGEYEMAVAALQEAAAADPDNARYQLDLADTRMQAAEKRLEAAERLLAENQATPARQEIAVAQEYVPGHPKALRLAGEVDERVQKSGALAGQSETALQAEKWEEAVVLAAEASRADAGNPQARAALTRARAAAQAHGVVVELTEDRPPAAAVPPRDAQPRRINQPPAAVHRPSAPPPRRPRPRIEPRPSPAEMPNSFRGVLSRDDDRYPKKLETIDGIIVKLEDTDSDPLEADLTIRVGRYELTRKHVRIHMPIYGRGSSGRSYRLIIEGIAPKSETVFFVIEAVSPQPLYTTPPER